MNKLVTALNNNNFFLGHTFTLEQVRAHESNIEVNFTLDVDGQEYAITATNSAEYGISIDYKTPGLWSTDTIHIRRYYSKDVSLEWNTGSGAFNGKDVEYLEFNKAFATFSAMVYDLLIQCSKSNVVKDAVKANYEHYVTFEHELEDAREIKAKNDYKIALENFNSQMTMPLTEIKDRNKLVRELKKLGDTINNKAVIKFQTINSKLDMENLVSFEIYYHNGNFSGKVIREDGKKSVLFNGNQYVKTNKHVADKLQRAVIAIGAEQIKPVPYYSDTTA